jgi:tetratricopeptide (TPR) repeat protein
MAALKALDRAGQLQPESSHQAFLVASINHRLGLLSEAIEEYKKAIEFARRNESDHMPSLQGLAEAHYSKAMDSFEQGAFGLFVDSLTNCIETCTDAIHAGCSYLCIYQIMGEAGLQFRLLPDGFTLPSTTFQAIDHASTGLCHELSEDALAWVGSPRRSESAQRNNDSIFRCSSLAFYRALQLAVKTSNAADITSTLWHELGLAVFYRYETMQSDEREPMLEKALKCLCMALQYDALDDGLWNTLARFTVLVRPSLAQHSLIRALELNPKVRNSRYILFLAVKTNVLQRVQNSGPTWDTCIYIIKIQN